MKGLRKKLANNLKRLMDRRGMRFAAELHRASGVSNTQIGCVLRGEKAASVDVLERFAAGLKVDPVALLADDDLLQLLADYGACSQAGKDIISAVAAAQKARESAEA